MLKLNRIQLYKALNLEQDVCINTDNSTNPKKKIIYVLHSFQMGATHFMCESGCVPLFKRRVSVFFKKTFAIWAIGI